MTDIYRRGQPRFDSTFRIAVGCLLSAAFVMFVMSSERSASIYSLPAVLNFFLTTTFFLAYTTSTSKLISPYGILSLFLIYFISVAPILHLQGDFWLYLGWTSGQPEWLALWCAIQGFGFLAILGLHLLNWSTPKYAAARPVTQLPVGSGRIILALLLTTFVFRGVQFGADGGLAGLIRGYAYRLEGDYSATEGGGALLVLADMSQVMLSIAVVYFFRHRDFAKSDIFLALFLALIAAYTALFSGLKGSRGPTILACFYALGLYHFAVRHVGFKFIGFCLALAITYLSVGSWYKFGGVSAIYDSSVRQEALRARQIDNEKTFVALRDFSRADVQSFTVMKLAEGEFSPSLGRSYVGAVTYLIPRSVLPSKPETFAKEKTELRFGKGTYARDSYTRLVAGQYAEMIANFGILVGSILFFVLVHIYLSKASNLLAALPEPSADRLSTAHLMAPFLAVAPVFFLTTDSNVLAMQLARYIVPIASIGVLARLKQ